MLDVSKALSNPGQLYPFTASFVFEEMDVMGDTIRFENTVLSGDYMSADEKINVNGEIETTVHAHCANCLEPVTEKMVVEVDEVFARNAILMETEEYPLDGHSIALEPMVQDRLLLELPIRFLCKPDCLGLCPVCGKNRNKNQCTCPEGGEVTNPFSALSKLLNVETNEEV